MGPEALAASFRTMTSYLESICTAGGGYWDGSACQIPSANGTHWCVGTAYSTDQGWQSNHCAYEAGGWIIAQIVMLIAYIAGWLSTSYSIRRYRFVWAFRVLLILYAIIMIIWCETVSFADDQLSYAIITMIVCLGHWAYIMYHERPITLNDYLHNLWHKMFNMNGYNLELLDFYNLMQEKAFLKTYKKDQVYITEGDIPTQLSILLSGKMSVYKRDDFQRKSMYMVHHSTAADRRKEKVDIGTS